MTTDKIASLKRLLDPKKIAIIGASNAKEKVGGIVFRRLLASRRRLFAVNPNEIAIEGHKVYSNIALLPDKIDLAVITIGAAAAVKAVKACIQKKIPNYILVAGGFGEVGSQGRELEEKLKTLAQQHKINILGPNSLGIFLPNENIDTIFVEHGDQALDRKGKVACIVQSGSVGVEALGYAANTGYGMRAFVGLGNKCDLDEIDFLHYFAQDEKTNCLGFYLENIEKGRQFLEIAKQTTKEKPVVVLKAGRTHTAASAVTSHTGKLAGSDKVISGALKQFGIQRVYDDEAFCDATKVLSMLGDAPGDRVAVLTAAGGYGVMCTDFVEKKKTRAGLRMAKLSRQAKTIIKEATFPFTACDNPVDITASATDDMFSQSLDALIQDDGVDIIICIAFFAPPGITENLIDIIAKKIQKTPKPIIVFTKYGPFTDTCIKDFFYAGVVAYPSIRRAVRAARFLVERKQIKHRLLREEAQS
ncbi:MAG: CoA-binding protein [Desulfobacula sp.]|nr:CoA-binding protein [Desulfobacula sp.]